MAIYDSTSFLNVYVIMQNSVKSSSLATTINHIIFKTYTHKLAIPFQPEKANQQKRLFTYQKKNIVGSYMNVFSWTDSTVVNLYAYKKII